MAALPASSYTAAIDSYAIWQIFDLTAIDGYDGNVLSPPEQADVRAAMTAAFSATQLDYEIYIYTPDPQTPSQDFLGIGQQLNTPYDFPVPEGSTVAFFVFNSLALAGIMAFVRRRAASRVS